jgi:microcystin-dependent protein
MALVDQLRQRRDTARQSGEQILVRASEEQRDLTAEELAEHRQHVQAEREASDELDQLRDDQIAELRAQQVLTGGAPAPRGPVLTREQSVRVMGASSWRSRSQPAATVSPENLSAHSRGSLVVGTQGEGQQGLDHRVNDRLGAFLAKKRSEHK